MLNKKFDVLEGDNLDKLMKLAAVLQKSTLHKDKLSSVEKTAAIMLHGMEVGLSPTQSLKNIDILFNTPTLNADAQLAIARNSGELESFEEYFLDKDGNKIDDLPKNKDNIEVAVCVMKRKGLSAKTTFYSREDAGKKALLAKDNWKKDTPRMLRLRARSFNTRDNFGDKLAGLQHSTEEMQDEACSSELSKNTFINPKYSVNEEVTIDIDKLPNEFNEIVDKIHSLEDYENCKSWYEDNKEAIKKIDKKTKDTIINKLKDKKDEYTKKEEVIIISMNDNELKEAI